MSEVQAIMNKEGFLVPKTTAADLSLINDHVFGTKPFEHQKVNLARLIGNNRWLLADEMGCGKSHSIVNRILHWEKICNKGEIELSVLILCPKSVVYGWVEQLYLHTKLFGVIIQGNNAQREELLSNAVGSISIANYELLLHHDFSAIDWDVIVLDEIHRVKNFTAKTSKAVRKLTQKNICVYGLSGTPAPNGLEDWFGVLSAIDPNLLPTKTKTAFESRYCVKRELQPGIWKVAGYKNVQELHGFIQSITSRVTKEDVLDLPSKTYLSRKVELSGERNCEYIEN